MKVLRIVLILIVLAAAAVAGVFLWRRPPTTGVAVAPAAPVWTPIAEQRLDYGRFKQLAVYTPASSARGVVLLLSGTDGWTPRMSDLANRIARQGALVVGIDLAQFDDVLEKDGGECVFPDGDLENLSHFIQAYSHLPGYLSPILAGYSAGGTLAYATLVQAPPNTFAAAVSMNFCPAYPLRKPLCKGSGVGFSPRAGSAGVDFLPAPHLSLPWIALQGDPDPACDAAAVRRFVAQVPGAQLIDVPPATAPSTAAAAGDAFPWAPSHSKAFDTLIAAHAPTVTATGPSALGDLPIVPVTPLPGAPASDTFAILLSGDGGWAGLDKEVAGALAAKGIFVAGVDSLRYFWSARTPAGLAADLDRMIDYYGHQLGKRKVVLVGYSQGADVLPFAVNRLSPATRSHVVLTAILGMSEHALFEFHMSSWVSDDDSGPATMPEVERISGAPVLCIYGAQEDDSLCPRLDPHKVVVVKLKGGHHFDGDYDSLARTILAAIHP
jgi:type IV secretory pathway VirJ component